MNAMARIILFLTLFAVLSCSNAVPCGRGEYNRGLLCLSCKKLSNSAQEQTERNRCLCEGRYRWSPSSLSCEPIGNLQSYDQTSEKVGESEKFSKRKLQSLSCNWVAGYILFTQPSGNQLCVHCSAFQLTDGRADSPTSCLCIAPAVWQQFSGTFACICYDTTNALYLNGSKCELCSKLPYDGLYPNCTRCSVKFADSFLGCVNCSALLQATGNVTNGACDCKLGYAFSFTSGKCECSWLSQGYYLTAAGVCSACSALSTAVLKANCFNCEVDFLYFNGSVCMIASAIAGYNATTQTCTNGQGFLKDLLTEVTLGCGCVSVPPLYFFINGTTCTNCNAATNFQACNDCDPAQGYFNSSGQCVFCKTLPKSDGTSNVTSQGCQCTYFYFFNISSAKCECNNNLGYYTLANGSCFSCVALNNTNLASPGKCNCKPGYGWNGTVCVCSPAFGGFNSPKGCAACVNMVGASGTVLLSSCACIPGYAWNSTSLTCVCDTSKGYTIINKVCMSCSILPYTDGTASSSGCGCLFSYVFIKGECSCYSSNGLFISDNTCSSCKGTLPLGTTKQTCLACSLSAGFYLDPLTGECIFCTSQLFTRAVATESGCKCDPGAVWNNFYKACVCDFHGGFNLDVVNNVLSCVSCPINNPCWNCTVDDKLWLDSKRASCSICPHFPNYNFTGATVAGCNCKPGYVWNARNYPFGCVCGFNNGGFFNGTTCKICLSGTGNAEIIAGCKICDLAKYFFLSLNGTCLYCKMVPNANTTVLPTIAGCACKPTFRWSSSALSCIPSTPSPCAYPKTISLLTNSCICTDPFKPDPSNASLCVCNPALNMGTIINGSCIDCQTVDYSKGTASGHNCDCLYNLVWLQAQWICGCPQNNAFVLGIGCLDCSYTTGSTKNAVDPNNPAACACDSNMQFTFDTVTYIYECGCPAPYAVNPNNAENCSCAANAVDPDGSGVCFSCVITNGPGKVDNTDKTKCACNGAYSFFWNATAKTGHCGCNENSAMTPYGCFDCTTLDSRLSPKTLSNDPTVCDCNPGFVFVFYSDGTAYCNCGPGHLPTPNINGDCDCDPAISIRKYDGSCFSCLILHGANETVGDPAQCVCEAPFVFLWDSQTESGVCGCPSTSIPSQDTCYTCSSAARTTGQVSPYDPSQCACISGFFFIMTINPDTNLYEGSCNCPDNQIMDTTDPATPTCKCDPASALTKTDGSCYVCDMDGGDGTTKADSSPLECTCGYGVFIWNAETETGMCDCVLPKVYSKDSKNCGCDPLISMDVGDGECLDCRGLASATGETVRPDRTVCECVDPYSFVWADDTNKSGSCQCVGVNYVFRDEVCFDCRIPFSNGTTNPDRSACSCKPPTVFSWDSSAKSGQCVCPQPKMFNPSRSSCYCDPSIYLNLLDRSCFSCSIDNNSAGTANNKTHCNCDEGFTFRATAAGGSCICDASRSIVPSAGVCYYCGNVEKSLGIVSNTTACRCAGTGLVFTWDGTSGTCDCPEGWTVTGTNATTWKCICAKNYILLGAKCVSCAIDFNTGGTAKNGTVCNCNAGYVFISTNNIPKCICNNLTTFTTPSGKCFSCAILNSLGVAPNATACKCLTNFTWIWQAEVEIGGCECRMPKIMITSGTNRTCTCPITAITLNTSTVCFECKGLANSLNALNTTNKSACGCIYNFMFLWDVASDSGSCVCKTGSFPNGTFANGTNSCFMCSAVKNSTGTVVNGDSCGCKTPFIWIPETKTCTCPPSNSIASGISCLFCPADSANGTGVAVNLTACGCKDNFVWKGNLCTCSAPLTYTASNKTCNCNAPYEVNSTGICVCPPTTAILNTKSVCVLCSSISNNDGGVTTNATSNACKCKATFVWVANTSSCSCPAIAIPNPLTPTVCLNCDATIFARNKSGSACLCQGTLTWNASIPSCTCGVNSVVQVNGTTYKCILCNSLIYAAGKVNEVTCRCSFNMIWNGTLGSCFCAPNSILASNLTCVSCSTTAIDKYHCSCPSKSFWNTIVHQCQLCSSIPNSNGSSVSALVCGCKTNFYWNVMTLTCTAITASCSSAKATIACMDCGSIRNTANTNAANKTASSVTITLKIGPTIPSLLNATNTIYGKLGSFMCNCAVGYKWEARLFRCYNLSTSTL